MLNNIYFLVILAALGHVAPAVAQACEDQVPEECPEIKALGECEDFPGECDKTCGVCSDDTDNVDGSGDGSGEGSAETADTMTSTIEAATEASTACEDTDKGLKDVDGDGCDLYTQDPQACGNYDGNEGFVSNQMCCACGGGKTSGDSDNVDGSGDGSGEGSAETGDESCTNKYSESYCSTYLWACTDKIYKDLMLNNCKKACGACSENTPTTANACEDLNPTDCPRWKTEGICGDPKYVGNCLKTCGMCLGGTDAPKLYHQNEKGYDAEIVEEWNNKLGYNKAKNAYCAEDCQKICVKECPKAIVCNKDQLECGKTELPADVWPDCAKDDICIPKGCKCQIKGKDGSMCPLWCETYCTETQIKCPGKIDTNGCREEDVCINRPPGPTGELCPGYCPIECDEFDEHICSSPTDANGCPKPPTCKTKAKDNDGNYCDKQNCIVVCDTEHKFCAGIKGVDGCYEPDICVPRDISDSGAFCDGNCPIECKGTQVHCDGQIIYHGPNSTIGCKTPDTCLEKARDVNGKYCPDSSDSHKCPKTCPDDKHLCPPRTHANNCKEEAACVPCTRDKDGNCCPQATDCPALCQPHEAECKKPGVDEKGCPTPPTCVVQERDYYGELCEVHCEGICNHGQILCPGDRDDNGCPMPPTCQIVHEKLWGDSVGELCPGFCPAYCQDWEILCGSVHDPCDGCPTEQTCKPRAKNENQVFCPPESASHGCAISCKTLDGENTICPAYENKYEPGCKDNLKCVPRIKGKDGHLCPEHSVCEKRCAKDEKKCEKGFDKNDCKNEDLCIPVPRDERNRPCLDFQCPPSCDERVQKYCQGDYTLNENNQLCPLADYCVDRPVGKNGIRCPGHCNIQCGNGFVTVYPPGTDARGCPFAPSCERPLEEWEA